MLDAADRAAVLPGGTDMASRELIDDRQRQEERLAAMDVVEGLWAAPRLPDSGIGAISCCTLPVQVLVVNFLRSPVAER